MMMGNGSGPLWLMILIGLAAVSVAAFALIGRGVWRERHHPDFRAGLLPAGQTTVPAGDVRKDPMVMLRERLVRGEIDLPEFEKRLEALLRSDPAEQMPWWNSGTKGSDDRERRS